MRILLMDVGNSRIKWRVQSLPSRAGRSQRSLNRAGARQPALRAEMLRKAALPSQFAALLRAAGPIDRLWVSNVAGPGVRRALQAAARRQHQPAPRFARSQARAAGVRNAYTQHWRLGVDRWLALLGARARYPAAPLCIVGVGTALTIDVLDGAGRHRGGLIVPGPTLMASALLARTAGIRRRASGGAPQRAGTFFANDTRAALILGAETACAALLERALQEARLLLRERPRLIVGGGAATRVLRRARTPAIRCDGLVLDGLAVLAGAQAR